MECSLATVQMQAEEIRELANKAEKGTLMGTVILSTLTFGAVAAAAWLKVPLPYLVAIGSAAVVASLGFLMADISARTRSSTEAIGLAITMLDRMGKEFDRRF